MTAPTCDQCRGRLYPCDVLSGLTVCVECARKALRASRVRTAPTPGGEWAIFLDALRRAADASPDHLVHQGKVRPLIQGRIYHKAIGGFYRRARHEGVLVEVRLEDSTDRAGRNTHHKSPVYELRSAA